ncbi:OmpP1/FadL family transporter [Mucilaginibacter psychrotolerans]|uniref:Aromatic hydrocarbon degradation protein n=1 Tax=Mucilaginibacter psychrotolerans TaxID=1524096 RepID=A0A4Y8S4D0_9SPHI|nr:outer membrane protein transport protein [Mucilaginibacter psychrotolerans]TFF33772.1 hypothetical protein E2R66_24570 [Mucilaginibacter psychrotolerans]
MKIKYLLSVIAIVAITQNSFAQYAQDAVRFSTGQTGSTARIKGVGNAGTAIGGDLSSVSGNPAGLGFFTHSELSITPEYNNIKVNSSYLNSSKFDTKSTGNLNHAAFVIYQQLDRPKGSDKTKGWLSFNYGGGYSRTANFYENINYAGKNSNNSINDYYANLANDPNGSGIAVGTLSGNAYDHNLIDNYGTNANPLYKSNSLPGVNQQSIATRSGGLSALDFAFGANYSNKFYIGAGVSFVNVRFNSLSNFYEDGGISVLEGPAGSQVPVSRNYSSNFTQDQDTKGSGVSGRLGVIFKPADAFRIGAVIHTPTYYTIDDSYSESLGTTISNGSRFEDGPQNYSLTYTMRTPWKFAGGASIFIKSFGFITGDIEYVDYSSTHISSDENFNADRDDNPNIRSLYQSAVNYHLGAEARLTSFFLLRGGYGIQGKARRDGNDSDIKTVSGGMGLRFGQYYLDATYTHATGSQTVFPYEVGSASPSALLNKTLNNGYLTLGYRF